MRLHRFVALALVLFTGAALAQDWPQKPVKFIVPFPPGGATDISARLVGEKLAQIWGQQVIVENRGGAGGGVGAAEAARGAPGGYTLFRPPGPGGAAHHHIHEQRNHDPQKEFSPVTTGGPGPQARTLPATTPT